MNKQILLEAAANADAAKKTCSILAYSGGLMHVSGWETPVVIDLAGLSLPDQVKLLVDHNDRVEGVCGHGKASVRDGQLIIDGWLLAKTGAGGKVLEMVRGGVAFQASVGAQAQASEHISAGQTVTVNGQTIKAPAGGFELITAGTLREVSILPFGADSSSQVHIAARNNQSSNYGVKKMPKVKELRAQAEPFKQLLSEPAIDSVVLAGLEAEDDPVAFNRRIIAALHKTREEQAKAEGLRIVQSFHQNSISASASGNDSVARPRDILAAAAMLLTGQRETATKSFDERTLNQADELRCGHAMDLVKMSLRMANVSVPGSPNEQIKAAFSTGNLTEALSDSANKTLRDGFLAAPQTWKSVAANRSVRDFKKHKFIQGITKNGLYKEVGAGGELKHVSFEDSKIEHSAQTRGVIMTITRQDLINDDLGVFYDLQRSLGINAARTINKFAWDKLRGAGGTFFSTAKKNLLESSALAYETFASAIKMSREMKDADGNPISASPRTLCVPPALEAVGRLILNSAEVRDTTADKLYGTKNVWAGTVELVVEPLLGDAFGGSNTTWFMAMDKTLVPGLIISFLNGVEAPTVETADVNFDQLGMGVRAYLDFGVDLGDHRGFIKATE